MRKILLAVDGGATKTTMTIRTEDGRELFTKTSTGSNYQAVGQGRVIELFEALLNDAQKAVSIREITAAVFAIAGMDTDEDAKVIRNLVETSLQHSALTIKKLVIENDVEAALLGLAQRQPASLLISGTGSVCFSYDGEKVVRTGGWGHRAGDEGSGYWIGRQIVKAIFRAADGRTATTKLTELVLQANDLDGIDSLMNWLYRADYTNARLACLSTYLQEAVEQGDEAAREIAEKAAEELALLATAALQKIRYSGETHPFYINGGVLKNTPVIYDLFTSKLAKAFPSVQFKLCEEKPIEYIVKRVTHISQTDK